MKDTQERINLYLREDIQVISVSGSMTYESIAELKTLIVEGIADVRGYVFELVEIERIDSTGLGLLVTVAKHMIPNGNRMVIVNKNQNINDLLQLSKLNQVFAIVESVEKAIENLNDEKIDNYMGHLKGY